MRRVVRAASPEVLGVGDFSPCSAETSFRELDEAFLQTQTRIWLGEVLHMRFNEEAAIADLISDGELLFQVSKVVWKMLLKKQVDLKHSKVHIYERTSSGKSNGRYMPYPKVDSFLKICQILGLTGIDLFSPSDVVEKRDVRRVCMCIRSLSKKARSKNLDVPDFDIVTYTISMPNDLVGGIRRNLEQSQCCSPSSNGCSPCLISREIHRQKGFGGDHARHYDSYSESDEAESTFAEFEFQSPLSNLSHIDGEISSDGNSVFDENSSELQTDFQLDSQDQNEDEHKSGHLLAVSTNSSHARAMENVKDMFGPPSDSKLSSSGIEYQIDRGRRTCFAEMGERVWPISNLETGFLIKNVDIDGFQTRPSPSEDSSFELDKQLAANAGDGFKGYIGTTLLSEGLEHSLSRCTPPFDSDNDLDYAKVEFMKSSVGPSNQAREVDCTSGDSGDVRCKYAVLRETSSKGSAYMVEAHDIKPNCVNVMGSSYMEDDCNFKMCASCKVGNDSSPANLVLHSIEDGNFVPSHLKMPASKYNLHMGAAYSKFEGFKNEVKRKNVDEVVDAEVPSTPSLNALSDNASEDEVDSIDCIANRFSFSDLHSLKVEQCNFKLGISAIEDVVSVAEEAKNTNLYNMDTDEGSALLPPRKNSSIVEIDGISTSSASGTESCDPEELHSWMKTENSDSVVSFSSTICKQKISQRILDDLQLDGDCNNVSHVDSALISPYDPETTRSKDRSSTSITVSDDFDENEGNCAPPNICPSHIIGTFKEPWSLVADTVTPDKDVSTLDLEVDADERRNASFMTTDCEDVDTPELTANSLSVGESRTCNGTVGCVKHGSSTNFNVDNDESQLGAGNCDGKTEGGLRMKVVKQECTPYCHPCETYNDLPVEVKVSISNKLCSENTSTTNISEYDKKCSLLNAKDNEDVGRSITFKAEDSCVPQINRCTGCGESNQPTLSEKDGTIGNLHIVVSDEKLSITDSDYSSQQVVNASSNGTLAKGNDLTERKASAIRGLDHKSETQGLEIPADSNGVCTHGSNVLDGAKSLVIDNLYLEAPKERQASDIISSYDHIYHSYLPSTSSTHLKEDIRKTQVIPPCSAPACVLEREACTQEESIEVKNEVLPLVDGILTGVKHKEADDTPEREKDLDMKELQMESSTILGSSEDKEGAAGNPGKRGKTVLKSVAGGITLVGVVFLILQLRQKRGKARNRKTVVPSRTSKLSSKEGSTQKRADISNTEMLYPGERLKF